MRMFCAPFCPAFGFGLRERASRVHGHLKESIYADTRPSGYRFRNFGRRRGACSRPNVKVSRPRWYGLDDFSGPPKLIHWVARVEAMSDVVKLGLDVGPALDVTRGDLHWQLTVPEDGGMPFDGAFPSIIDWPDGMFPVPRMADRGCALERLVISHPENRAISEVLDAHMQDDRIVLEAGAVGLKAQISTPDGLLWL